MTRYSDLVSKAARDMGIYSPVLSTTPSASGPLIRLDSNENPFGPSPRAMEAVRLALNSAHRYPDDDCGELRRVLATSHDVGPEQVLVTAGSTGMLSRLCQALLAQGRNAVASERSFIVYGMVVRATGARLIEAPMRGDEFDLAAILHAINPDTRIVFLANPNNPTGTMIEASAIDGFLAQVPDHVVVVLDEAYYEFAVRFAQLRQVRYPVSVDYVRAGANVVVLRTFSKVHGLAGLRIGYGLGSAELLGYCARMASTYSVSSVAQAAALAALDDGDHIERAVSNNTAEAQALEEGLKALGYRTSPTSANFLYCDVGEDALDFALRLREQGVNVRPLGAWGAATCIRVSIGTPEENRIFLEAVRRTAPGPRR